MSRRKKRCPCCPASMLRLERHSYVLPMRATPPLLQLTIKLCKLHKFTRIYAEYLFTMNKDSDNIFIR